MKKALLAGGILFLAACTDNSARVYRSNDRAAMNPNNRASSTSTQPVDRGDSQNWAFKPWHATSR